MDFQTAIKTCLNKYATFGGRARRPEYWWFVLFLFLGNAVFGLLDSALWGSDQMILASLFGLAMFLPSLSAAARRLHDTGRSAWWLLIGLIPVLGFLVLIWFFVQPTERGPNAYGAEPPAA